VCTFQALVLAFKQLDESPKLCSSLLRDLDAWLVHILSMNIKMTKSAQAVEKKASRIGLGEGEERAPPEYVRRAMARNMERHEANLAKGRWTEHKKKIMREKGQARAEAEAEGEESWPLNEEGDNFGHNCNKTPTGFSTCSLVGLRSLLDAIFGGIFGIGAEDKDTATDPMEVDEKEDNDEVAVASSWMCDSK
jgi:hypothetical protein